MQNYYVAQTPNGKFVGTYPIDSIISFLKTGDIQNDYVATKETRGGYPEVVARGDARWVKIADLLVGMIMPEDMPAEEIQPIAPTPIRSGPLDGGIWEYRILSQRDQLFSGRFDSASLTLVLNQLAAQGWRVICVTSAGVNTLLGGNRDEIMIFLERKKK